MLALAKQGTPHRRASDAAIDCFGLPSCGGPHGNMEASMFECFVHETDSPWDAILPRRTDT